MKIATLAIALASCSTSHEGGPDGGGVCCPIDDFSGCSPGFPGRPGGGWAPSAGECTYTIDGFDGRPWRRGVDERGCPKLVEEPGGCCGCVRPIDAGEPVDAGPDAEPFPCEGLATLACMRAGCVPTFDDACCRSCEIAPACADCTHYVYHVCRPFEAACGAMSCSRPPTWLCGAGPPDCSGSRPTAEDACDLVGCVPSYPPGSGDPDPATAICVPIHPHVCGALCRRAPPPCPRGTVPEGDGDCFTDRCIPAFVCEG